MDEKLKIINLEKKIDSFFNGDFYNNIFEDYYSLFLIKNKTNQKNEIILFSKCLDDYFKKFLSKNSGNISNLDFDNFIKGNTFFLEKNSNKKIYKIMLMEKEELILNKNILVYLDNNTFQKMEFYFNIRLNLIIEIIENFDEKVSKKVDFFYKLINIYINRLFEYFCLQNKIFDSYKYFKNLINKKEITKYEIKEILFYKILELNSNFLILNSQDLEILVDYSFKNIDESLKNKLKNSITIVEPSSMIMPMAEIHMGKYEPSEFKNKEIITILEFTIPFELNEKFKIFEINENIKIEFFRIRSYLEDPIYNQNKGLYIGEMGIKNFSDSNFDDKKYNTTIKMTINYFYNPELESDGTLNDWIKKSYQDKIEQESLYGRITYPHKHFIIKNFRENFDEIKKHLIIEKEEINIDMFNAYFATYIDKNINKEILKSFYPITDPNKHKNIKIKFIDKLNKLNLKDNFPDIKDLIFKTDIKNAHNLNEFVTKMIDIIIKKM